VPVRDDARRTVGRKDWRRTTFFGTFLIEKRRICSILAEGCSASNAKVGSSILSERTNQIRDLAYLFVTDRFPAA